MTRAPTLMDFRVLGLQSSEYTYLHFDPGSLFFPLPLGCGSLRPCCSPGASGWTAEPFPWYFRDQTTLATQLASAPNYFQPETTSGFFSVSKHRSQSFFFFSGQKLGSNGFNGDEQNLRGSIKKTLDQDVNVPELQELLLHKYPHPSLKMYHADHDSRNEITQFNLCEVIFKIALAKPALWLRQW